MGVTDWSSRNICKWMKTGRENYVRFTRRIVHLTERSRNAREKVKRGINKYELVFCFVFSTFAENESDSRQKVVEKLRRATIGDFVGEKKSEREGGRVKERGGN